MSVSLGFTFELNYLTYQNIKKLTSLKAHYFYMNNSFFLHDKTAHNRKKRKNYTRLRCNIYSSFQLYSSTDKACTTLFCCEIKDVAFHLYSQFSVKWQSFILFCFVYLLCKTTLLQCCCIVSLYNMVILTQGCLVCCS